jgi:hypothetical protein
MHDQRQHDARQRGAPPGPDGADDPAAAEQLSAARDSLDRIYAAADAILDQIERADNARFLAQVRQAGGQ